MFNVTIADLNLSNIKFVINDKYLQVQAECIRGKTVTTERGRKWYMSPHMIPEEKVQTAFLAYMTFVEHEVRELFLVNGADIFSPHLDLDALAKIPHVKRTES